MFGNVTALEGLHVLGSSQYLSTDLPVPISSFWQTPVYQGMFGLKLPKVHYLIRRTPNVLLRYCIR